MPTNSPEELKHAIESQHGGTATFSHEAHVLEVWEGKTVWNGMVSVFNLTGHPTAKRAYAWSSPIEGSKTRLVYAVLHVPPVDSPQKAVQAAIVHEYRTKP